MSEREAAVEWWNTESGFHPLTCGNDSQNHRPLVFDETNVVLRCLDCAYMQTVVPPVVFKAYSERVGREESALPSGENVVESSPASAPSLCPECQVNGRVNCSIHSAPSLTPDPDRDLAHLTQSPDQEGGG